MLKIIAFFISMLLIQLIYGKFGILLTCGQHLYELITSLTRDSWTHKTRFNSATFYCRIWTNLANRASCMCVQGYRFCLWFMIFFLLVPRFWNCSNSLTESACIKNGKYVLGALSVPLILPFCNFILFRQCGILFSHFIPSNH